MIIVHDLDDSRSQRILWLLEELGVPYEIRQHKRVVAESGAIIDYVWEWSTSAACKRCGYNDYVRWMHYAEGSGMLAPIVRINVARVGEAASPALRRLDSEIALHLNYLDSALNGRPYILGPELSGLTSSSVSSPNLRQRASALPATRTSKPG